MSVGITKLTSTQLCKCIANLRCERDALAAENARMLKLLSDISGNHIEYYSEGECGMFAGVPIDYVSEINSHVARDVDAKNPFQVTDVYLAKMCRDAKLELCESLIETFTLASQAGRPFADGAAGALAVIKIDAEKLRKEYDQ